MLQPVIGAQPFVYIGDELDLFANATRWKQYWSSLMRPYLGSRVLDVGAGIGSTAKLLATSRQSRWLALEPDDSLASRIEADIESGSLPANCEVAVGTLASLRTDERFDTILYVDVLEHIEDDREELHMAARFLSPGGYLMVLSPAHQWLFTPFDERIGHFRRYSRKTLKAAAPSELRPVKMQYLDCAGVMASLANKLLLKSALPTSSQISLWDRRLVPASRLLDPLVGYHIGKSILGIWTRDRE